MPHPSLWAPGHPKLYPATLTLSDSRGRRLQGYFTDSGIRTIAVKDGRLELNGRFLNLRGVDLHEQTLQTGAAMTPAQDAQLMSWVQQLGATVIRAHYPVGPEIEEMADRDGILIWSEIPVYQVQSQYLGQPAWLAQAHAMLEDNILDNENHPRSCCGRSATSFRRRRRAPRRATSRARSRSRTSSIPPARSGWRSATGPAWAARAHGIRST